MCRSMEGCICVQAGVLALTRFDCHQLINYQPNKSLNAVSHKGSNFDVCKRPCVRECCAPVSCNLAQAALLAQGLLGPFACALAYPLEGLHIKSCELHQSQLDWGAEVGAVLSPCPLDPMPIITS